MFARIKSRSVIGINAKEVNIEVDIKDGLPKFAIVGLPDTVVRESIDRVRAALINSGFRFPRNKVTVNLQGPNITIHGDLEGITEVFSNLVENAIKYNRPGGRVDISIEKADGFAVVTVADTGIGVSEKDRKRIFERFFRADLSRGVTVGTGLGLSIVKAIVEAHGGHIELESELGSRGSGLCLLVEAEWEILEHQTDLIRVLLHDLLDLGILTNTERALEIGKLNDGDRGILRPAYRRRADFHIVNLRIGFPAVLGFCLGAFKALELHEHFFHVRTEALQLFSQACQLRVQ